MYNVYKFLFKCVVYTYLYTVMPLVDTIVNIPLYLLARIVVPSREIKLFNNARHMDTNIAKFNFMESRYEWTSDPLNGLLNWNWRSIWVAALMKYHKDCDGYAYIMEKLIPGGEKYAILPYNPKYWKRAHVIYVYNDTVFSSGLWHRRGLNRYLDFTYDGIDHFFVEIY